MLKAGEELPKTASSSDPTAAASIYNAHLEGVVVIADDVLMNRKVFAKNLAKLFPGIENGTIKILSGDTSAPKTPVPGFIDGVEAFNALKNHITEKPHIPALVWSDIDMDTEEKTTNTPRDKSGLAFYTNVITHISSEQWPPFVYQTGADDIKKAADYSVVLEKSETPEGSRIKILQGLSMFNARQQGFFLTHMAGIPREKNFSENNQPITELQQKLLELRRNFTPEQEAMFSKNKTLEIIAAKARMQKRRASTVGASAKSPTTPSSNQASDSATPLSDAHQPQSGRLESASEPHLVRGSSVATTAGFSATGDNSASLRTPLPSPYSQKIKEILAQGPSQGYATQTINHTPSQGHTGPGG